ncbi:response regulator [bacterium]|nr:MAG: response regulator [bacterium]
MNNSKEKVKPAKKILIIEDENELCDLIGLRLERSGFEVITANDGVEGLNKARFEKPDLIILDLILPKMPGEEVCKQVRKDALLSEIPIIMLTAKCSDTDKVIGGVIGANVYIAKPFEGAKLIQAINKLLG